ncbi:MAG: Stp1/IreP family PP2C-type Ser/Thr phosphatase [Clostridia bacterium]|nr:Stp1/IreP family PP2C-type Ser/Thr phosphatase [Clostridia bacterium]
MQAWSMTDVGKKRRENQDSTYVKLDHERNMALLMVCDGMGGVNGGAEASRIACEEFARSVWDTLSGKISGKEAVALLEKGVSAANMEVYTSAISDPSYMGMGTTLTAALIVGEDAYVINVGDSRAYHLKRRAKDKLKQITDDHSVAGDLFRKGSITKEQYDTFPDKNIITRAVGTDPQVYGDVFELRLDKGEVLMLCSDGLTNMVPDMAIEQVLKTSETPADACQTLVDMANRAGGKDNISIVVFIKD